MPYCSNTNIVFKHNLWKSFIHIYLISIMDTCVFMVSVYIHSFSSSLTTFKLLYFNFSFPYGKHLFSTPTSQRIPVTGLLFVNRL